MSRRFGLPLSRCDQRPTDVQGKIICIGAKVAFNQSGNVVPGQVIKIRGGFYKESWGPVWEGYFLVQNTLRPKDKESKVKSPTSILVL